MSSEHSQKQNADQKTTQDPNARRDKSSAASDPDVLLDSPQLSSDEIELEIEDLNLAKVLSIGRVKLSISDLEAQLLLEVRLKKVLALVDRLLDSVDRGMDEASDLVDGDSGILQSVKQTASNLLGEALGNGSGDQESSTSEGPEEQNSEEQNADSEDWASQSSGDSTEQEETEQASGETPQSNGSAGETVDKEGRTVRRTVDESSNIIETRLNGAGEIVDEQVLGNLEDFVVEEEFFNEEGLIVSRMRDENDFVVSGLLDSEGNIIDVNDF